MINSYVAIDLETTGINPVKDEILEIGAIKVIDGEVTDVYKKFICVTCDISPFIVELTGITKEMSDTGITLEQAVEEITNFCDGFVLLGHNIKFDYSFLKAKAMKYNRNIPNDVIDTLKIARVKLKELSSRSLSCLCEYYNIPPKISHRAFDDAESTMKLYKIFQEQFADDEELFESYRIDYKPKKESPITQAQKRYLSDLLSYHGLSIDNIENLTKSEASKQIDGIIRTHGKISR